MVAPAGEGDAGLTDYSATPIYTTPVMYTWVASVNANDNNHTETVVG